VVIDEAGKITSAKAPTTPQDNTIGVLESIEKVARALGLDAGSLLARTDSIIHASTTASNALIMLTGARTGTICTQGFRDVVEMRRGWRGDPYNLKVPPPPVLSPRYLRREVEERVLYDGSVAVPLNEKDVEEVLSFYEKEGVESIAVCFLFSFLNPDHERRVAEMCRRRLAGTRLAGVHVSLSSDVLPMMNEFERFSTTTVDAYVAPKSTDYTLSLVDKLRALGFQGQLFIGACSGGVMRPEDAIRKAVYTIESGPAAAPVAAAYYGPLLNSRNILAIDMGGTTFKASLVPEGRVETSYEMWFENQRIAVQMVDVHSIGAGGGSIAWLDSSGAIRVGPASAGADPGPACYGKGGREPTVTDADVLLGYIPDDNFLGGEILLQKELAARAIQEKLADPLHQDVYETAYAVYGIVTAEMADAVEEISVGRGIDPRDFDLVVGGGAAPVHAALIADALEIQRVYIPTTAALLSAFGWLSTDLRYDFVRSQFMYTSEVDLELLNRMFREMEEEARSCFSRERDVHLQRTIDARYAGQFHDVQVEVPSREITQETIQRIREIFDERHKAIYTFSMPARDVMFTNYRVVAVSRLPRPALQARNGGGSADPAAAFKRHRDCYFRELQGFRKVPSYEGPRLTAGNRVEGPATIEEVSTTILVPPRFVCTVDPYGNYVLERRS